MKVRYKTKATYRKNLKDIWEGILWDKRRPLDIKRIVRRIK
ncbi:MAG: hypothetical protein ACP6IQ_01845 [Candidatus Njordarchaeia archaeon]